MGDCGSTGFIFSKAFVFPQFSWAERKLTSAYDYDETKEESFCLNSPSLSPVGRKNPKVARRQSMS